MSDDEFERRLRDALRTRADGVRPDPAMWARVRDRAERRSRLRWMAAVAAVTPVLVIAVAVAVLPRPGSDGQVILDPGPSPTASPTPSPVALGPSGMVLATDPGIVLADPAGQHLATLYRDRAARECGEDSDCEVVASAKVRPGTTDRDAAVAFAESFADECPDVGVAGPGTSPWTPLPTSDAGDACDSAPVWSPEGLFVAFLRQLDDGVRLAYMAWDREVGAPYGGDYVTVDVQGGDDLSAIRVHDWVWTEGPREAPTGFLLLTARDADGRLGAYQLAIARPLPDEFALEPIAPIEPLPGGEGVLAHADGAEGISAEGPSYTIEPGAAGPVLTVSGHGGRYAELALPAEVVDPADPEGARVWLVERAGLLLFGDGVDDAWRVDAPAIGEWGAIEPLPGDIRAGDLLSPSDAPAASEPPLLVPAPAPAAPDATPQPEPSVPAPRPSASPSAVPSARPSAAPSPADPEPSETGELVSAVEDTRRALVAAAQARSYDELEALLPPDGAFGSNDVGEPDHLAYYQQREADGVDIFGELAAVLQEQPQDYGNGRLTYGPVGPAGWVVAIDQEGVWRTFADPD